MIFKYQVNLETEKNGRIFTFHMPVDATFADCHAVALDMANAIEAMAKQAEEKQKAEAAANKEEIDIEVVNKN